jgi:hypothetical protein
MIGSGLPEVKNNGYGNAPLFMLCKTYTHITAKTFINPLFLSLQMNCPDSSSRNKAKNALSLAIPISPGMAEAKIQIFSFVEEKCKKKTHEMEK